jgi:hypothetical protein
MKAERDGNISMYISGSTLLINLVSFLRVSDTVLEDKKYYVKYFPISNFCQFRHEYQFDFRFIF